MLFRSVFTGTLGGLANYFMSEKAEGTAGTAMLKYVLLGIVAALTVPLFLNMISSDLLAVAKSRPNDLYVFGALCLAFVLFSRRFMGSATAKFIP